MKPIEKMSYSVELKSVWVCIFSGCKGCTNLKIAISAFLIVILINPTAATSQDELDALRKLTYLYFQAGLEAQQSKDYHTALEYYGKALVSNKKLDRKEGIAVTLHNIGLVYYLLEEYDDALKYFNNSLKMYEQIPDRRSYARTLNNIGNVFIALREYNEALEYYKRALKIREDQIPQDIAISLLNIGSVYIELSDEEKALEYYRRAFRLAVEQKQATIIMRFLENVHFVYNSYDRLTKYFYQDAVEIFDTFTGNGDLIKATIDKLMSIASQMKLIGDYSTALKFTGLILSYVEGIERKYAGDAQQLDYFQNIKISSISRMAWIYAFMGHFSKAIEFNETAQHLAKDQSTKYRIGINLCSLYGEVGDYQKALNACSSAQQYLKNNSLEEQALAECYNSIGTIYFQMGFYDKAVGNYEEARKLYKKLIDDVLKHNTRSLKQPDVGQLYALYFGIVMAYDNIGAVYLSQKQYDKAEKFFKEASTWKRKNELVNAHLPGNPGLVDLYIATGKTQEALSILEEMTPSHNVGPGYVSQFYTQFGIILDINERKSDAVDKLLIAIESIEEWRSQIVHDQKIGFFQAKYRNLPYKKMVSVLAEESLIGRVISNAQLMKYGKDLASSAFYFSESTKARSLLEAMAEAARKSQKTALPEGLRKKEEDLLNQLSPIESLWEAEYKKGEAAFKELKDRKERLTAELNDMISDLRQKYPIYAALYYPKPVPLEQLPLRADEALLEYAAGDDATYVFVVSGSAGSPPAVKKLIKIPVSKEALEKRVKAFIKPMNKYDHERFSVREAKALYDLLLSEALKEVKTPPLNSPLTKGGHEGGEKIVIVPDGILGLLPFEALVIKEGEGIKDSLYVGDRYSLSYYQSASVLALERTLKGTTAEKPLFALGNPIYSKEDNRYVSWKKGLKETVLTACLDEKYSFRALATRREIGKTTKDDKEGKELEFDPLPETEGEVKAIAKLFDVKPEPQDILLNIYANETELWKAPLKDYRYIHFATHAISTDMVQGLKEPFILLGQVENRDGDDGFLRLSKVLDLKLNADMVVLSACVTGRGEVMEGEGIVNFARAFQHAGARSVVVSLWEVASDATVEYMTIFYSHLKAGKGRVEALRLARSEIKKKYPNPFYWAPFILHGEG